MLVIFSTLERWDVYMLAEKNRYEKKNKNLTDKRYQFFAFFFPPFQFSLV